MILAYFGSFVNLFLDFFGFLSYFGHFILEILKGTYENTRKSKSCTKETVGVKGTGRKDETACCELSQSVSFSPAPLFFSLFLLFRRDGATAINLSRVRTRVRVCVYVSLIKKRDKNPREALNLGSRTCFERS